MTQHVLGLRSGSTYVELSSGNRMLTSYTPIEPDTTLFADEPPAVEEAVSIVAQGSSTAAMQSAVRDVQRLLLTSRRRAIKGIGPRVFLERTMIGDATVYRSEVLGGRWTNGTDFMQAWSGGKIDGHFTVTRRGYWEGARTEIPLSNGYGTDVFGGIRVDNVHAGSRTNRVKIDGGDVDGVLPAPLEVRIKNDNGAAVNYRNWMYALNVAHDPHAISYALEGESRLGGVGSVTSVANYSNGQAMYMTIAAGANAQVEWTLGSSLLSDTAGGLFRIMVLVADLGVDPWYAAPSLVNSSGLTRLAEGQKTRIAEGWNDLGTLPLPPGGYMANWGAHRLRLRFYNGSLFSGNVMIDCIHLAATDGNRTIDDPGGQLSNGEVMIDDVPESRLYSLDGSSEYGGFAARGRPIYVVPGENQSLTLWVNGGGSIESYQHLVSLFYRPRILAV